MIFSTDGILWTVLATSALWSVSMKISKEGSSHVVGFSCWWGMLLLPIKVNFRS
jgi:hypothetical protein